jgi:hypothetical protein
MSFCVKAICKHGEIVHRRRTPEAALGKAREMAQIGCYDVHIVTPEGRDYHSSEFGDLPRSPKQSVNVLRRLGSPSRPHR